MSAHTPGPWIVVRRRDGLAIAGAGVILFGEGREADAALIAAAPDLLGAGAEVVNAWDIAGDADTRSLLLNSAEFWKLLKNLRAAVAKAKP